MKTFAVSLNITTQSLTIAELSDRVGIAPSPSSHDKGTARVRKGVWEQTVWVLESSQEETAPVEEHLQSIFAKFPPALLHRENILPDDAQVYLDIAVFFDTAMCSVQIPPGCVDLLAGHGIALEVTCYPSTFDEERRGSRKKKRKARPIRIKKKERRR